MLLFVSSLLKEIMHYICIDYEEKVHIEMKFLIIVVRYCIFFVFAVSFLPLDAKDMMNAQIRFFFLEDK